jgi:SIR2-like domain
MHQALGETTRTQLVKPEFQSGLLCIARRCDFVSYSNRVAGFRPAIVMRGWGTRRSVTNSIMSLVSTSAKIIDLQRSEPGTEFASKGYDRQFLNRMRACGYLDSADRRTSGLERLRLQYDSDGLVLFLGAGVSKASGIPEWRELIDLMLKTLKFGPPAENGLSLSRLLEEKASLSLLSQFDLVSHQCEGPDQSDKFVGLLREHLYGAPEFQTIRRLMNAIPVNNAEKKRFDWQPLLMELRKNTTLAAVGDLLTDQHGEVIVNPKIGAVLTTNADNLLQAYVMGRAGGRRLLTTVDRASVGDHPRMISIYHLHGWLDVRDQRERTVVTPPLVFRESEYFDTMANPNAFANYTAQSLFQRRNALFIGTSMEDVNIRRWLYNSFEERRRHREQFLRARYGDCSGVEAEAHAASVRHFWLKRAKDLPEPRKDIQDSITDAMRHLGVEVIWYKEHSEVAGHLQALSRSPNNDRLG